MTSVLNTTCFNLGVLGAQLTQEFSTHIAELGINHKQVGILALIDTHSALPQRELAQKLNVAPSLIVNLLDQLVAIGAVTRKRNERDRRIQVTSLTKEGKHLLRQVEAIAHDLDNDFRASLSPTAQAALDTLLAEVKYF